MGLRVMSQFLIVADAWPVKDRQAPMSVWVNRFVMSSSMVCFSEWECAGGCKSYWMPMCRVCLSDCLSGDESLR